MLVSIVTSYYNRKTLLLRTLESIKRSSIKNIEFIIVDDGSDDAHRLEDVAEKNSFIKLIRLEKNNKWYVNPCIPFNIGFKHAAGEIIVIQNPECYHLDDILSYATNNLTKQNYISFGCYSLDERTTNLLDENSFNKTDIINRGILKDGEAGWYNHSSCRPVGYHFCSAIHRQNLIELGGFDERYASGIGYDDNELLDRIHKLGLKLEIVDSHIVLHQWHYSSTVYQRPDSNQLSNKNKLLFEGTTKKMNTHTVNNWLLPKIPRRMNFYWDASPMSYLQYLSVVSFHKYNPDWQIYVYEPLIRFDKKTWITGEHVAEYVGENYYEKLKALDYVTFEKFDFETIGISNSISEVFKSDFIRWYLLDKFGGGWSDMDVLYLKPLNDLNLNGRMLRGQINTTDVVFAFDDCSDSHYLIGFLLSSPGNGVYRDILNFTKNTLDQKQYQSVGCTAIKKLYPNLKSITEKYKNLDIANLNLSDVYPYRWNTINELFNSNNMTKITDRTIAIHWYNGAPASKKFVNEYSNNTHSENVITKLIYENNIK